ncbi:hypothetical protein [Methanothrix sp.]|uniref:hypothetical protein n=1 Tax=Methanothrix sp. TaxID=90426 RepID=UPI00345E416D
MLQAGRSVPENWRISRPLPPDGRGGCPRPSPEYASRSSGIEIKSIGDGYSMQVRSMLAGRVLSFAPKEIEAP